MTGRLLLRGMSPRPSRLDLLAVGSEFWKHHLFFRDYLRAHPETAREYVSLEYDLAERFRHDREGYTRAKTSFVEKVVASARADRLPT